MEGRKPIVGDIVHYVRPKKNEHLAAVITEIHAGGTDLLVTLTVFPPMGVPYGVAVVEFDQKTKATHTWHFIEPTPVLGIATNPRYEWGYDVQTSD